MVRRELRGRLAAAERELGNLQVAGRVLTCEQGTWRFDLHSDEPAPLVDLAGKPISTVQYCDHRLCPRCARRRANANRDRILPGIRDVMQSPIEGMPRSYQQQRPLLMVLTQRARAGESLKDAAARLLESWQRMRRRQEWLEHIRGALLTLEVTRNVERGWWHVHLNVLADGDYWKQAELLELWRDALMTPDDEKNGGVHVERVADRGGRDGLEVGLFEAVKYVTKGISSVNDRADAAGSPMELWDDANIREMAAWLRRRRVSRTYGTFYRIRINELEELEEPPILEGADWSALTDEDGEDVSGNPVVGINAVTGRVVRMNACTYLTEADLTEHAWAWVHELYEQARSQRPRARGTSPPSTAVQ